MSYFELYEFVQWHVQWHVTILYYEYLIKLMALSHQNCNIAINHSIIANIIRKINEDKQTMRMHK